ncbi:MAG: hypothetical protein DRJ03_01455 [Chloroflexi bacterium]|nr:MAG: hypothetical protein DRJ03_01455 [Chloroflexota bacterium]
MNEHLMTTAEAAMVTGSNDSTWRRKCGEGKVPGAFKKGKTWLIPVNREDFYTDETDRLNCLRKYADDFVGDGGFTPDDAESVLDRYLNGDAGEKPRMPIWFTTDRYYRRKLIEFMQLLVE